jgi:hypothetical protein
MDRLNLIWNELTLGPVSVFSVLSLLGVAILVISAYRNVSFKWAVLMALVIALIRIPITRYKQDLLGIHDDGLVAFNAFMTFFVMAAGFAIYRLFHKWTGA